MDVPPLGLTPLMVWEIARAMMLITQDDQMSLMLVEPNSRIVLRVDSRGYVLESARAPLQGRCSALIENGYVRQLYLEAQKVV
jgi:branched-chain amino acid transport system ATP-binding protein